MSKCSKLNYLRNLGIMMILVVFVLALSLIIHTENVMAVELYFDESGNLMHVTKDSATSAYTCFRSVGWVIKRYDMPLDAKGQQYIVVPKRSDRSVVMEVDGASIRYVYFKSTKEEILNAVGEVSSEWLNQLLNYGGDVYIDTAMTVVENKVVQGGIDKDGKRWGEVYLTYDGIAGARAWGGYDALKLYFGMCVRFPCLYEIPKEELVWEETEYQYSSEPVYEISLESFSDYKIYEAIPSGSRLHITGKASRYKYLVKVGLVKGTLKIPVKVSKTYELRWKDNTGKDKVEYRNIDRYYVVERTFSYYNCKDVKLWKLKDINLYSKCFVGDSYNKYIDNNETVELVKYGGVRERIEININEEILNMGTSVLTRPDGMKPEIPEEDFSGVAQNAVGQIMVNSDKLSIESNAVLQDTRCVQWGRTPIFFEPPCLVIDMSDLYIKDTARNERYESTYKSNYVLSYNYTGEGVSEIISKEGKLNSIKVHTPVISKGEVSSKSGEKDWQGNELLQGSVAAGKEFEVHIDLSGYHSDYSGYGDRDYSEYVGSVILEVPFSVYYNNELIEKNTPINVGKIPKDGVIKGLKLGKDVECKEYEILLKVYAINSIVEDTLGGEYTNAPTDGYYATDVLEVNVIRGFYDMPGYNKYKVVGTH